ncbi:MAG: hypothetical protein M1835_003196 [Candelina submexicana]|nr:MAG: hypothetical protein M1835_003196 [Candelina submexicana]
MHSIRSKARRHAWYSEDEKTPNYNPFGRTRSRGSAFNEKDLETGLSGGGTNHSESCVTPSSELARANVDAQDFNRSNRASTMPPTSEGTLPSSQLPPLAEKPKDNELSSRETDETLVTDTGKARKRRFFKLGKKNRNDESMERTTTSASKKSKQHFTFAGQIRATVLNSWINILLIAVPIGIIVNYVHVNPIAIFTINFIAIIPLAALLSYATEEIALRTSETLGGLLNATFGNAVELIVAILALVKKEVLIVQTSLIGSILSNLLLVMGMSFFFGGINRIEQFFNVTVAQTAASLLALAIGSLIIPGAFGSFSSTGVKGVVELSRGTAVILLLVYASYLVFQLRTHTDMYNEPSQKVGKRKQKGKVEEGATTAMMAQMGGSLSASAGGQNIQESSYHEPKKDEEKEEPQLSLFGAIIALAVSTALVAICAEFMVSSIGAVTTGSGLNPTFVGLILLPIVGNAAEHATSVTVAIKDKMDLAIGVAVGSSMQIALLVIPFVVILGWILGNDDMTLNFDGFQIAVLFVAILLVNYLIQDGKSHWLEGVLLMATYIIIAVAAQYYPVPPGETLTE